LEVISATDVAGSAAAVLEAALHERLATASRASLALSGGSTPWQAVERLAGVDLAWDRVDVFQVDERVAPAGDPARNAVELEARLLSRTQAMAHLMPVERTDLDQAVADYAARLPPTLDVVQLGLGADGHTASLVPGDPVLDVEDDDVGVTGEYRGNRRMTLTYPAINRAGLIVWIVTGAEKREAVRALLRGDPDIPAGRIRADRAVLVADRAALGEDA